MKKLKIALLIDWYLPGTRAGGPVRSIFSLVNLLRNDYHFYIITTNTDLGSSDPYTNIAADQLFIKDQLHYYYFSKKHLSHKKLNELLDTIGPDLIYLNSFWSIPFSISVVHEARKKNSQKILLAPRGMLGQGALGLKAFKKRLFIFFAKNTGWYTNVTFHATQEQEKKDIQRIFPNAKIILAPNINASPPTTNRAKKQVGSIRLFYLSRVAEVKNLHFALQALSHVTGDTAVTYDIYGNLEDVNYWSRCEKIISALPSNIQVNYKGEIGFDRIPDAVSEYHALLLPTLNENFGHSIVESMLCGCAVIISDQTPWNDVQEAGAGFALSLDRMTDFTKAVQVLAAESAEAFRKRSDRAIKYISSKIDLNKAREQYEYLFRESTKN